MTREPTINDLVVLDCPPRFRPQETPTPGLVVGENRFLSGVSGGHIVEVMFPDGVRWFGTRPLRVITDDSDGKNDSKRD